MLSISLLLLCFSMVDLRTFPPLYDDKNHSFIIQFSDVHIDRRYVPGSNPYCENTHQCCRTKSASQTASAGYFGFPGTICDIPVHTYINTLQFIKNLTKIYPPMSILMTGDFVDHLVTEQTQDMILRDCVDGWNDMVKTLKSPDYPVLISIGNHDSYPNNVLDKQPGGNWFLKPFSEAMSNFVDPETVEQARLHGYYSYAVGEITFVVLNTQWINKLNPFAKNYTGEETHPMMNWMIKTLTGVASANKKAIIVDHIPPSKNWDKVFKVWNKEYVEVMNGFSDIILFTVHAHEHDDRFFLTRDSLDNPTVVNFVVPPVTTFVKKFPSVRVYVLNKEGTVLEDVLTFYNNLNQSNEANPPVMDPYWYFEYSMKEEYFMDSMSPNSFSKLVQRFSEDDSLFDTFTYHFTVNYQKVSCRGDCKLQNICLMNYTKVEKYNACVGSRSSKDQFTHPMFEHWYYLGLE